MDKESSKKEKRKLTQENENEKTYSEQHCPIPDKLK